MEHHCRRVMQDVASNWLAGYQQQHPACAGSGRYGHVINQPGDPTITINGSESISSITCNDTLSISNGSLTIASNSQIDGNLFIGAGGLALGGATLTLGGRNLNGILPVSVTARSTIPAHLLLAVLRTRTSNNATLNNSGT